MNLENFFIKQFNSQKIGNDGAVIGKNIYVQDAFFENIHFKRNWLTLSEIAYKSVLVNISDIYAMNGIPKFALLTVAIPKNFSKKELKELSLGFKKAEKDFKIEIIGGDTISNNKLDISVTIIGKVQKPIITREAKINEFIAYSGVLGRVSYDLQKLLKGGKISKKSKFIKPTLNPKFIYKIAPLISAGMDISDGLLTDIQKIASESRINFKLKKIKKNIKCSGEEYNFLFTFPKRNLKEIFAIGRGLGVKITIFGETTKKGIYRDFCKPHHF